MEFQDRIFVLAALILFFVNLYTLKDGHNWGDDFSQYIKHSINIVDGRKYSSGMCVDCRLIYPPGFPLLIAPFIKFFGVNLIILKAVNVVFWLLSTIIFYRIASNEYGPTVGLLSSMVLLSSPWFFMFKQSLLSDVPFLAFSFASIYTINRYLKKGHDEQNMRALVLPLFLMCFSLLIRAVDFALFIAITLYLLIVRRACRPTLLVALAFIITLSLQNILGASTKEYFSLIPSLSAMVDMSWDNARYTLMQISYFFFPVKTEFLRGFFTYIAFLSILLLIIKKLTRKSLSFIDFYLTVYLLTITLSLAQQGPRYLLPIVGFFLLYVVEGLNHLVQATDLHKIFRSDDLFLSKSILIILLLQNIYSINQTFDFNDNYVYNNDTHQLVEWVLSNTSENQNIMFFKPRLMTLLTNRTNWYWYPENPRLNMEKTINSKYIDLLIMSKPMQNQEIGQINSNPARFTKIWENPSYIVYKSILF